MSLWMAVEDEQDINDVVLGMFEAWGINGLSFMDGEDAIRWIDSVDSGEFRGELPQLAVLDIRLPTVSGIEVSARLRRSKRLSNIAIVLMTAYRLTPGQEERVMLQAKADALVYKPLPEMTQLREIFNSIVANNDHYLPFQGHADRTYDSYSGSQGE